MLPNRERIEDDDREVRVLTRTQLDAFLRVVHPKWRPLFELLAWTGLRWGEISALRVRDLVLDGSQPRVRVRRAVTKVGRFKPPKSRYGRRDVPLDDELVRILRAHIAGLADTGPEALAFPARNGQPLRQENVRRRVLRPAAEEADAPWIGFHTFRHGFTSMLIERGTSIVQVSRLLGHASPGFTLRVYGHLVPGDEAPPLSRSEELAGAEDPGIPEPDAAAESEPSGAPRVSKKLAARPIASGR